MANPHPKPGPGRPKGSKNKVGAALKEMILVALEGAHEQGSVGYLQAQAKANPVAFLSLVGKVLPMEVTGEGGGPVIIVTGVPSRDEKGYED
jgi:hypothetical protein